MNLGERVTIIHGPNGYGKTTVLRLLDGLASGRYSDVRRIPFRDFEVNFDDGHVLQVLRIDSARTPPGPQAGPILSFELRKGDKPGQKGSISAITPESLGLPPEYVERIVSQLKRVGANQWREEQTGAVIGFEEVYRSYAKYLPIPPGVKAQDAFEPEWLREFRGNLAVRFIESQRLLRVSKPSPDRQDFEPVQPAVTVYARDLAKAVQLKFTEYATLSQSLDRSFPKRLVEQTLVPHKERPSVDKLKAILQANENRRATLTQAGLLEREPESFDLASYLSDQNLVDTVLPVYAADAEQKLRVFDDIAPKIELLTSIVNAHFKFKEMSISKERGFEFMTKYPGQSSKPRRLRVNDLSSGEQHLLVLLYELLFTVKPNSLIMIDEPEISLHVAWQLEFLNDIQKITSLTGIDVLLATHAPGIINERLKWAVGLEAPAEAQ
jgi:ABC-type transport system involved in cytochrome c biogenesis ATPase subunit